MAEKRTRAICGNNGVKNRGVRVTAKKGGKLVCMVGGATVCADSEVKSKQVYTQLTTSLKHRLAGGKGVKHGPCNGTEDNEQCRCVNKRISHKAEGGTQ